MLGLFLDEKGSKERKGEEGKRMRKKEGKKEGKQRAENQKVIGTEMDSKDQFHHISC